MNQREKELLKQQRPIDPPDPEEKQQQITYKKPVEIFIAKVNMFSLQDWKELLESLGIEDMDTVTEIKLTVTHTQIEDWELF